MAGRTNYQRCMSKEIRKMRGKTTSIQMAFKMAANLCSKKKDKHRVHRSHRRHKKR